MKFCGIMAVSMGLPLAQARKSPKRSPIPNAAQRSSGCTAGVHRLYRNSSADLPPQLGTSYFRSHFIGLPRDAKRRRRPPGRSSPAYQSVKENAGKFILVVEGSAPLKDGGKYCMIAGVPSWISSRRSPPRPPQ